MAKKPLLGPYKTKDEKKINWEGSSSHLKKNIEVDKIVNFRMQVLGGVIVFCMILLVTRLYNIQINNQDSYQSKLDSYTRRYQTTTTPRGEIVDRTGTVLVTNRERLNITYYPPQNAKDKDMWTIAEKFSNEFNVDYSSLKTRDLQDLFIKLYPKEANAKITDDERAQYRERQLNDNDIYRLKLNRIQAEDLQLLTETEKKTWSVYQLMTMANSGNANVILSDVTYQQVAYLNEHIDEFPGFNYAVDWERDYPYGTSIRSFLGSVTTNKQGLPAEKLNYYLAQGYSRNEKIGRSGLELFYEDILSGERIVSDIGYDLETGVGVYTDVQKGSKGYDLKLALDYDLQNKVEQVVMDTITRNKGNVYRKYFNNGYIVVMDPNTGDVLSLVGIKTDSEGNLYNDPISTYTEAIEPGSAIKGATMYMGLAEGVVKPGEVILDTPMKIKDTPLKSSSANLGLVNDLTALSKSSNIYMFHIAIRLGKATYSYDQPLNINMSAFDTMRYYYSLFGLGTMTGIDATNETTGYKGFTKYGGNLLDYAIGQYDTYTPMQLAQYISTIANGGYRVKPRLAVEAYLPGTDTVAYRNEVEILSSLSDANALSRVQQGFRLCVSDGYCKQYLGDVGVPVAAKTGTAQNTTLDANGTRVDAPNSNLVAYAPYDKPEIAIACSVRNAWNDKTQINICQEMTAEIMKYYFMQN